MLYYRVKPTSDNISYKKGFLVQNELYTPTEVKRKNWSTEFIKDNLEQIEISKKSTYYFFGARFCLDQGYRNN